MLRAHGSAVIFQAPLLNGSIFWHFGGSKPFRFLEPAIPGGDMKHYTHPVQEALQVASAFPTSPVGDTFPGKGIVRAWWQF